MKAESLIIGNTYLWIDPDGQSRTCKYEGSSSGGYMFKVRGYHRRVIYLSEVEVEKNIFRSPVTPL